MTLRISTISNRPMTSGNATSILPGGPAFIRIGRQNLAWGETDIFRLLDQINPLDNTFGGPFEDLDDRRIPLWMLRGSYNLGSVGPVASLTMEGFWVPGSMDAKVGPWAPWGTPYEVPLNKSAIYDILVHQHPGQGDVEQPVGGTCPGHARLDRERLGSLYRDIPGSAHHAYCSNRTGRGAPARHQRCPNQRGLSQVPGRRGQHKLLGVHDRLRVPRRGGLFLQGACLDPGDQRPSAARRCDSLVVGRPGWPCRSDRNRLAVHQRLRDSRSTRSPGRFR